MQSTAPAFFKPTTILLVDDDERYIKNIATLIAHRCKPVVVTPNDLDKYRCSELFTVLETFSKNNQSLSITSVMNFFSTHRNSWPVSTIVIDYDMAPKDGLSILREFKSSFIQKILISNFLQEEISRDAINQGVIDFYLPKMDPLFIDKLAETVAMAQHRFFYKLSAIVPDFFSHDNPLREPQLYKVFKTIQSEYDAEYYESHDHLRRFTFFNGNGSAKATLHIWPEAHIDELVHSIPAESAPQEVRELILSGKTMPIFVDDMIPDGKEWHKYLQPANLLNGSKKYVYSICGAEL